MRVRVLVVCVLALIVSWAFAWGVYATPADMEKQTGKKITQYKESPMLADLVKQGKLPPVQERLPEEPLVIIPHEEVGQFGGTWRRVWKGLADQWGIYKIVEPHLVYWDMEGGSFLPGLAKAWDILEDGRVYIFYLRKGVKWSDGHPYTVDDILFWVEDMVANNDLTPTKPEWFRIGGQETKVTKIDDYTIKFEFGKPYALFMLQVAYSTGFTGAPKHYLKRFHPKYTPMEKIEAEMKKVSGVNTWVDLFNQKNNIVRNVELPVLGTWKAITDPTEPFYVLERNPYFWAVDIEGNQLPYIDYIRHEYVTDNEIILLRAISGQIDMQWRHIGGLAAGAGNYTLLKENEKKGDYRVLNWIAANGSVSRVSLNPAHPDPVLRKIFNDVRFRRALSLAIDREEISEVLFNGMAKPRQASFVSGSAYYDPEWEKAYADYNPDLANKLLDEMGLKWNAKREYRLLPDGRPLRFTVELTGQMHADVWTIVKEHWKRIGVWIEVNNIERSLLETRMGTGEYDAAVWAFDRAAQPLASPMLTFPAVTQYGDWWYAPWSTWLQAYLKGETPPADAEVPPQEVIRLVDLWQMIQTATSDEEIKEYMREVTKIHRENLWLIGTVGEDLSPAIVKNNFRNVPEKIVTDDVLRSPLNAMPMQFFIKQK